MKERNRLVLSVTVGLASALLGTMLAYAEESGAGGASTSGPSAGTAATSEKPGCRLPASSTPAAPYHVRSRDGRCVWSCGAGTTPEKASQECVCKAGYSETGKDRFGRRTCTPDA